MPAYPFSTIFTEKSQNFVSTCRNFAGIHSLRNDFVLILQTAQTVAVLKFVPYNHQTISQNLTTLAHISTPYFHAGMDLSKPI